MADRPAALQGFLNAASDAFLSRTKDDAGQRVARAVFGALATAGTPADEPPASLPVVDRHLAPLTTSTRYDDPLLADLAKALRALSPHLTWKPRAGDNPKASATFAQGHANAIIAGPGGLERRSDVWLGVSLLAPDVRYPDHTHAPEETYLTLSPGAFRQEGRDWAETGTGCTYYNPPGIVHMMRSGAEPFLTLWALNATASQS